MVTCRRWRGGGRGLADVDDDPVVGEVATSPSTIWGSSTLVELGGSTADRNCPIVLPSSGSVNSARPKPRPDGGLHARDLGHLVGDGRAGTTRAPANPPPALHDEVALEAAAHLVADRGLGRRCEHRDEADQRHPDERADAVAEVRFGLRAAFSVARRAVDAPDSGEAGAMARTDGPASDRARPRWPR